MSGLGDNIDEDAAAFSSPCSDEESEVVERRHVVTSRIDLIDVNNVSASEDEEDLFGGGGACRMRWVRSRRAHAATDPQRGS